MRKKFCRKCFLIGFFALFSMVLGFWASTALQPSAPDHAVIQASLKQATLLPSEFKTVPEFKMRNQHAKDIGRELFMDRWSLVFFGYTHCPDICPQSMAVLHQAKQLLQENEQLAEPQMVFVSVDPKRDTAELLGDYMSYFDESFIGLSGSEEQTQYLTRNLGVVYYIEEGATEKENYLVGHSSAFLLISPDGHLQALFSSPHDARTVAEDYQQIVQSLG